MKEEKLEKLLNELTDRAAEPVRPGLAEDIKHRIPHKLMQHRGMDTINVMIDLRISKLASAAVIIIAVVLWANFFSGRDSTGESIFKDGKLMVEYFLGGSDRSSDLEAVSKFYEYLIGSGKEVVYYGDSIDPTDSNALVMQWRLPSGEYRVIFGDLREGTVSAEELIKLQAQMLQKKTK